MNRNRTFGIVARIACVLLCLVLFSAHLCSGMFARYSIIGEGKGSGRVARANIAVERLTSDTSGADSDSVSFNEEGNGTYSFKVTNHSEVALRVDMLIELKALATSDFNPDDYYSDGEDPAVKNLISNIQLNGQDPSESGIRDDKTAYYVFTGVADLAPSTSMDQTLTLTADIDAVTDGNVSVSSLDQISIRTSVTAKATQIN